MDEKKMDKLTFLWRGARHQDSLLQAYRNFHFITQSVLLAIGSGLTTAIVSFAQGDKANAIYCLLIMITTVGVYSLQAMKRLIAARSADVNYYHSQIIATEKDLPEEDRILTAFKIYQRNKGKDPSLYPLPVDLTAVERMHLIEKGKGHTRQLLDTYLSYGFYLVWLAMHAIALSVIF